MSVTLETPIRTRSFRFVRKTENTLSWNETKKYQRREARLRRAEFLNACAPATLIEVRKIAHGRDKGSLVAFVKGHGWHRIFAADKDELVARLRRHGIEFDL
jgi:hypothetical protein